MLGARTLHTIGHSNHSIETFLGLLKEREIETVVDVRSWPASRRLPHFNRAPLRASLQAAGIGYLWFGKDLGGKSDWEKSAAAPAFGARLDELAALAEECRAAILCAEEDPLRCHRKHLLAKPLSARGVALVHIRGDGGLVADEAPSPDTEAQLSLFAPR